jgi:hypothetical protein
MNPSPDHLPWQELVDRKARELIEQAASAYEWVKVHGNGDPAFFDDMAADQFRWLRELYAHELPLAKMLDESDLTVELLGPAAKIAHPRLSVVASTFTKIRKNVAQVTKAVAGVREPQSDKPFHLPEEMELGFSSLVHNGTVRFGFTLPRPEGSILKSDDPLFRAVEQAVTAIRDVSFSLADYNDEREVEEVVKHAVNDPKLRDSALIAIRDLSPSHRSHGIDGVTIAGGGVRTTDVRPLTKESRLTVKHILAVPVRASESITLAGIVRETDLDDKRFEVRGIQDGMITDLRCIYGPKVADEVATRWLNKRVEVEGRVERDASGRPRLMKITRLKLLDGASSGLTQEEFQFPDEGL